MKLWAEFLDILLKSLVLISWCFAHGLLFWLWKVLGGSQRPNRPKTSKKPTVFGLKVPKNRCFRPGSKCESYGATATANSGGLCGTGLSLWATSNVPLTQDIGPERAWWLDPFQGLTWHQMEIFKLGWLTKRFQDISSTIHHQPSTRSINLIIVWYILKLLP